MLVVMAVTLYTSRVILQVLGVDDFGIYNVVGGLATSFVFFSTSLSNATQRFLNFELGKSNLEGVNRIFNLSLLVYLAICVVVILIVESFGIWFLNTQLVIPSSRLYAANWVLQCFALSLCVNLLGTVFDSVLIARENMKIYAYSGLLDAFLKLAIVYLLLISDVDRLVLYGVLLLLVTVINKTIPVVYCLRRYSECKIRFLWDKSLFISMFKFIGWNGMGTAVWAVNEQGVNILLNIFFGPAVNAARAIAQQVNNAINNFTTNFFVAVRPQIVKSYASSDLDYLVKLIFYSSKYGFYLMWLLSVPIMFWVSFVLHVWLDNVPVYADEFLVWILIYSLVNVLTNPFWSTIQAVGKLKKYILVGSLVYLSAFPISYVVLKLGYNPVVPLQILSVVRLIYLAVTVSIIKEHVCFSYVSYLMQVIRPILMVVFISTVALSFVNRFMPVTFLSFILFTLISFIISSLVIVGVGVTREERQIVFKYIVSKVHHD